MPDRHPLLIVSVDAMHTSDIPLARTLPAFSRILENAAVAEIEGVYPSLTYPNHIAQITGCAPARSGIFNNLAFQPGQGAKTHWLSDAALVKVPTLFDVAKQAGLTTASVEWPVTVNAGDTIDWLMPELVCPSFADEGYAAAFRRTTNQQSFDRYLAPNLGLIREQAEGKFFDLVNAVAPLILRHEKPDLMAAHFVEVDTARHKGGSEGPHVEAALRVVDATLGALLDALAANGVLESTNIVIVSDHGHLDIEQHTNLNAVFLERGLIRVDDEGRLVDYDIFCHGAGLSGQLFLADALSSERRAEVEALLAEVEADPQYRIATIWTAKDAEREFGLNGPFDWAVETEPGVAMGSTWTGRPVLRRGEPDFPVYVASHGHSPRHGGQPVFIATGPDIAPGVDLGRRSMLDEAPTFAALLGLALPDAEGEVLTDALTPSALARLTAASAV